ncbi:cytochrome c biogenesis protein CcdA [Tamaricihabitans halophyticus]|uniref:Cytochrome c biogenesis protein CcdA n=1 Tax=Tamaricihabitans halophyticus TaxID=1262583 RepID=A0A4R2QKZ3_9PSEU|nr:cytochrome c biogenesis CcdA family protein [Tamaricihabitans halophyticus]TCP50007.1 cytochrome c biogenesis protein CcdA [Tamaricihabitans halophyticus]
MTEIGLLGAFLGGLLSLISPCSALLLPSFFAYAFDRVGALVSRTGVFLLGLCAVLVPLGIGAAALGSLITQHRGTTTFVAGLLLVALGVATLFGKGFGIGAAGRLTARIRISSHLSVFALGAVYGLAGACTGPLLGGVLTVSAAGGEPVYGGVLLAVYALGMVVPLFLLALVWDRFELRDRRWLRGRELRIGPLRTHSTSLISGALFIGIGLLFLLTEGTANLGGLSGVDTQYALQSWLRTLTDTVSNAQVILVAVLVALAFALLRLSRSRKALRREREQERASADD